MLQPSISASVEKAIEDHISTYRDFLLRSALVRDFLVEHVEGATTTPEDALREDNLQADPFNGLRTWRENEECKPGGMSSTECSIDTRIDTLPEIVLDESSSPPQRMEKGANFTRLFSIGSAAPPCSKEAEKANSADSARQTSGESNTGKYPSSSPSSDSFNPDMFPASPRPHLNGWWEHQDFGEHCVSMQRIVGNKYFELVSTLLIVLNCAVMALEVQVSGMRLGYDIQHRDFQEPPADGWTDVFLAFQLCFNLCFVVELLLRLVAAQTRAFLQPWLWFDSILVLLGILDLLNTLKVLQVLDANVTIVRTVRLLRSLRLVKLLKKHSAMHSLFLLFKSIQASVHASIWSCFLMLAIIVVMGLVLSQMLASTIQDSSTPDADRMDLFERFGTFTKTVITMFEITMANWVPPCRMLMATVGDGFGYMIVFYRCLFCFAVLNVVRAVFISETARVAAADDDVAILNKDRAAKLMVHKIKDVFDSLDRTGDGLVSWEEFECHIHEEKVKTLLSTLELDSDDCKHVFRLLDTDGAGGIAFQEFVDGVSSIRGAAKRIDIAILLKLARSIDHKVSQVQSPTPGDKFPKARQKMSLLHTEPDSPVMNR